MKYVILICRGTAVKWIYVIETMDRNDERVVKTKTKN
jgi:hypothetical protein